MEKQCIKTYTLAKLQCSGNNNENDTFDDSSLIKADSRIKSISIRSGEIIDGIGISYSDGLTTTIHGGTGGSLEEFIFDEDEYLIEINGVYGMWWNINVIKQITFVTTKRNITYGTNIYPDSSSFFTIKSSSEYPIIGFYGALITRENNKYLSQIGAIINTADLPDFYRSAKNSLVSTLYDPIFSSLKNEVGWTDYDEKVNVKFEQLKRKITSQDDYYNNPYESQFFNSVKEKIVATDLYSFIKWLPKGALNYTLCQVHNKTGCPPRN